MLAFFSNHPAPDRRLCAMAQLRLCIFAPSSSRVPPLHSLDHLPPPQPPQTHDDFPSQQQPTPPSPPLLDWFGSSHQRSSHFIAEKTCEMVCYLWFSTLSDTSSPTKRNRLAPQQHSSFTPHSNPATASLQFSVSPAFVRFMQKVLETTQVSESVIVLSLHYIYRMKARNRFTAGQAGSEYRVAVAALMMANKFVDDNTYTNKTWSEVSGIDLQEVNKMEREFLLGIDFDLYVDKTTYESWLNLLKGLVMSKERDSKHWRRSRCTVRSSHMHRPPCTRHQAAQYTPPRPLSHRARSSSPRRASVYPVTFSVSPGMYAPAHPVTLTPEVYASSTGSKRSAAAAFSPREMSFTQQQPAKRSMGLTLDIPQLEHSYPRENSPLESLQSFSKLSLGASPVDAGEAPAWASCVRQDVVPQTLVSAYRVDDKCPYVAPQNLYFYSLAGSPMDAEEEHRSRKSRLRYHQPPAPSTSYEYQSQPAIPMVVQSACASPYDAHVQLPPLQPVLPPFSEVSRYWADGSQVSDHHPQIHAQADAHAYERTQLHQPVREGAVPSAQFANAGPPGVQLYSTAAQEQAHHFYGARNRRY
ncbi:Cyclin-U4-3 [Grifola frondosa]|uniref:Cyclin-U4-3 n=1 Tax=Grifola frondosa TaxID=5627 RepID=A0A1C7MP98_GRIFR|nr:Cyclin-U4-3 [Grifola frondosa]